MFISYHCKVMINRKIYKPKIIEISMARITVYRTERAPSQQGIPANHLVDAATRFLEENGFDLFGRPTQSVEYPQLVFESSMITEAYCSNKRR